MERRYLAANVKMSKQGLFPPIICAQTVELNSTGGCEIQSRWAEEIELYRVVEHRQVICDGSMQLSLEQRSFFWITDCWKLGR